MTGEIQFKIGDLDLNARGPEYTVRREAWVEMRTRQLAIQRNAYARNLLEDRLPRRLQFLIDRPRALRWLLRVAPNWRPSLTFVDLRGRTPVEPVRMLSGPDGSVSLFEGQREAGLPTEANAPDPAGPVTIELPVPMRGASPHWDQRLVLG